MDQDQRATYNCPNSLGTNENSQCAELSQTFASPTPAQPQRPTEEDYGQQSAAKKSGPKQCSEEEHCISLEAPSQAMSSNSDGQGSFERLREAILDQSKEKGQEDDAFSSLLRKIEFSSSNVSSASQSSINQMRYHGLIEEAVKTGQSTSIAQAACQAPRLLMGGGKWQSTMVTLTVEGIAGTACHHFNSDLWRYGGRASFLRNPEWHEVDSIDLRTRHGHIEATVREAQTRLSTTWSWSSDENGVFRVHPEHIHVVEMVCGYLNLAVGREVDEWVHGFFAFPDDSSALSDGGLSRYLAQSFVRPAGYHKYFYELSLELAGMIDRAQVVEALTRVHGEPMDMVGIAEEPYEDDCLATPGSETRLNEGIVVTLPSIWSTCSGNPCICGDSVMVLDTTQEQLQVRELAYGEQYLAISYVWTQHNDSSLLSYIRRAIKVTGVRSAWVDRLCINQRCDQHKARQIPRMREVYQKGYATVALVPDITQELRTTFQTPTAIVTPSDLSAFEPFITQMKHCAWRTRCWTWQEGLLGRRGYYVTQEQVLPARKVSDLLAISYLDQRQVSIGGGMMESLGVRSPRCHIRTWRQEISIGDLLDAEDHELPEYWLLNPSRVESLGEALQLTRNRTASRLEDQIYSVLGIVPRGEDLQVIYGESRNEILGRAVNKGLVGAEILRSENVSHHDRQSWAAKDDPFQHIGQIYNLGGGICGSAEIDDRGLISQFHKLEGLTAAYFKDDLWLLRLENSNKEEITCLLMVGGTEKMSALTSRVDLILLLEEKIPGRFRIALLVSGTGRNVVRVATGYIHIEPQMKVQTQVVWRVVK